MPSTSTTRSRSARWRITPGVRFERIEFQRREDTLTGYRPSSVRNNKALPSVNVAYLLTPAS